MQSQYIYIYIYMFGVVFPVKPYLLGWREGRVSGTLYTLDTPYTYKI